MKKITEYIHQVSFDNGETWKDLTFWNQYFYHKPEEFTFEIDNFRKAEYFIGEEKALKNASCHTSLFGNKYIKLSFCLGFDKDVTRITEKNFKPFIARFIYKEDSNRHTIKDLARILSAQDFCEWLKDNGISTISNNLVANC